MKLAKLIVGSLIVMSSHVYAEETAKTEVAQSNGNGTAVVPAPQTSILLEEVAPKKSPWLAKYVNETRYGRGDASKGTGTAESIHFFTIGHQFEKGKLTLTQPITQNQDMSQNTAGMVHNDPYLKYAWKKVGLNHDWTLDPEFRYYAPTGTASKDLGSNGRLRADLEFRRPINGRLTFSFYTMADQMLHNNLSGIKADSPSMNKRISSKGGMSENMGGKYSWVANKRYSHLNMLGLDYEINKKWSFLQQVGVYNIEYYKDAAHAINHRNEDSLEVWSYLSYAHNPNVSFVLGLEQSRGTDERQTDESYTFMNDNETKYYLALSLGI